ncbi:MAG: DUF262 domain-containing HNH endonuclease family protein [Bacteroidales bacterium]|jgi:uncharacterized protein with ParB-like and HNH nuclease domain|nr:DUF262 domain-containing HNH endonuclease family protein [Bacteroidales bacterium]
MKMIGINDSTTNHFGSLIRSGGKYIIPQFQRDYSWEEEQWDDLWQDIDIMYDEKGEHYMGYLVLQTKGKDCLIIDGQQRFTTITIIILATIKAIQKLINKGIDVDNNTQRLQTLKDTYIGNIDPVSLEYDNILILNRNNNNYYKNYIVKLGELKHRNTSYTEKLMKKCFEWYENHLLNKFNTGEDYAKFITYIVDNLYFTIIKVSDEMNAFKVFETLNARGVQLSSADLLKNYLFSLVDNPSENPDRILHLEEKWSELTRNIQAEKLPDFIRYYWNSKHKIVRSNDLFKAIRQNIKTDRNVFELVDEMQKYSDIYMALRNEHDELWHEYPEISKNIEIMKIFKIKPYSLLMSAYKSLTIKDFEKILNYIIIIGFRYSIICGKNPNEIEKVYNRIANEIYQTKKFEKSQLEEVYVKDEEFLSSFNYKDFNNTKNNKIIKYILAKYEKSKEGGISITLSDEQYTIEHILPQNPNEEWGENNYNFDSLIYRLGNLCLLERKMNNDISNNPYDRKAKIYKNSNIKTTKEIPEQYSTWEASSINQRQQKIGKFAASYWKIEF